MDRYQRYFLRHPKRVYARIKRYRLLNPEKVKGWRRKYYEKNKEEIKKVERKKYWKNRKKILEQREIYRKENHGKILSASRVQILKKYNLTLKDYETMLARQKNRCAICKNLFSEKLVLQRSPAIDHDHETGMVRGLLCMDCNVKLGTLENEVFVKKASRYLNKKILLSK